MEAANTTLRVAVPIAGLAEASLRCCQLRPGHTPRDGSARLGELPPNSPLELLLPAQRVTAHHLNIPAGAGRHTAALVRQALEDRLLGDLADSHIVTGQREGALLTAWVVSRTWLLAQLQACAYAGHQVLRALPEQALLAPASHAACEGGWMFRTADKRFGLVSDVGLLPPLAGETAASDIWHINTSTDQPDLLQGLPRPGAAVRSAALLPLARVAALLLLGIALLHLAGQILHWRELAGQQTALQQRIRQSFAAAHPGVPIVNPILQWRQLQGRQTASSDALDQLALLAVRLGQPVAAQRIESDANGLNLILPLSEANRVNERLRTAGITASSRTTETGLEQLSIARTALEARP